MSWDPPASSDISSAVPDRCSVTVFTAGADDEALITPPRRIDIDIEAGDRNELTAGDGSALAIACTAEADAIKVAPQFPPLDARKRDSLALQP